MIEQYCNEKIPSDCEIYYMMRKYHFERRPTLEAHWRSRFRGNRQENLKALTGHPRLEQAFDELWHIAGLWHGKMISIIHTRLAMNSDDVGKAHRKNDWRLMKIGTLELPSTRQGRVVRSVRRQRIHEQSKQGNCQDGGAQGTPNVNIGQ